MAQSPLSQLIRRLEADVGTPCCAARRAASSSLPAGEVLLERAHAILAAVERRRGGRERGGVGRVRAARDRVHGLDDLRAPPAARQGPARRSCPRVRLDLRGEMLTPAQVEGLLEGALDVGAAAPARATSATSAVEPVRREPLVAALPADHPLAAARAMPVEAPGRRAVHRLPSQRPLGRARRGRGDMRDSRLHADRGDGDRGDLDARELRRRRRRRGARPGVGAADVRDRRRLPAADGRHASRRAGDVLAGAPAGRRRCRARWRSSATSSTSCTGCCPAASADDPRGPASGGGHGPRGRPGRTGRLRHR